MGWTVYYLGQGVPVVNIKKVIDIAEPQALMTMFVTPKVNKVNGFIESIMEVNDVPFIVSGSAENLDAVKGSERILKVSSPSGVSGSFKFDSKK